MTSPPYVVDDCRGVLQVLSDGSIHRSTEPPFPLPIRDDGTVSHKDVLYHPTHNLYLRLYRPNSTGQARLPLLVYFHGGGFCIGSRTWPNFHNWCLRLASHLNVVVASCDYRLAPEHRLPAAYDDAQYAVEWAFAHASSEPWLAESADLDRVFICGDSAGGNIVHHLAVRFGSGRSDIRGFIPLMPFFDAVDRTKWELECPKDRFVTIERSNRYWRLALPVGEGRDNPMVDPFGPRAMKLESIQFKPMLVVVGEMDMLADRGKDYVRRLKEWGKPVELLEIKGVDHCFFVLDPYCEPAVELMQSLKCFVEKNCASS